MNRDFRDESEAQEFIGFVLRTRGRTHIRKRVARAYEGIGEALALLLYGLDRVYLAHVFDTRLGSRSEEGASQAAKLLRLLPIGYLYRFGGTEPTVVKEADVNPFQGDPSVREARRRLLQALV